MAHILVVEDSDDLQFIFSWVFRSDGHTLHAVGDGQVALDYLADNTPNIIVLDINLPNVSGLEVAQYVRQQPRLNETRIIFVTGNQMHQHSEGAELGDLFLLKPVDAQLLVRMADRLLTPRTVTRREPLGETTCV